ncbi:hypothetical protein CFC21_017244 [Triticum aestivum]|uniref:BTB domain-containing protein n=2 Tax=Triticum aestivum TaxID=4565 RepID=A0A3B6DKW0_WHEAT|nr:hypothetical protein CFC21_017244 [Triticum aestivum]
MANHGECLAKTSSRCITETFTGTHDFEVTSYSLLEGMGVGKFVGSSTFSVGGYDWQIRFYPDGDREANEGAYASVFLFSTERSVKVKFTLNLFAREGSISVLNAAKPYTFESAGLTYGYTKFVEKSRLLQLNDFTIRCNLTVIKEPRTQDVRVVVVPPSNLHDHFASMLKSGKGADVKFSVAGQVFDAHACVLAARSPVFMAELFGHMRESTAPCIEIDDMEPLIFEALLSFIYTDTMPDNLYVGANMPGLLDAADRYGMDRLKAMCEQKLYSSISVQTLAATLALAEQHHCVALKDACLRFLSSRDVRRAVKATRGFKNLETSCPSVVMEFFDMAARLP